MVQVTDTAFNNLNVKALSLINIKQAIGAVFTTNYTLLLHYGSLTKETVTTFFTFPGAGIENLMETLKLEDHILNIINNKTVFDTNDAKTSFFSNGGMVRGRNISVKQTQYKFSHSHKVPFNTTHHQKNQMGNSTIDI